MDMFFYIYISHYFLWHSPRWFPLSIFNEFLEIFLHDKYWKRCLCKKYNNRDLKNNNYYINCHFYYRQLLQGSGAVTIVDRSLLMWLMLSKSLQESPCISPCTDGSLVFSALLSTLWFLLFMWLDSHMGSVRCWPTEVKLIFSATTKI